MREALTTYSFHKQAPKKLLEINVGRKKEEVNIGDILFIKALSDYIVIQTALKKFITLSTMGEIMDKLPASLFIRCHKSYIINIGQIKEMEKGKLIIDGIISRFAIPIGRTHKKDMKIKVKKH